MMRPEFPIRILFDDGECLILESPEELIEQLDTLDSTDVRNRVWVRDARDRTVALRMRHGFVETLEV